MPAFLQSDVWKNFFSFEDDVFKLLYREIKFLKSHAVSSMHHIYGNNMPNSVTFEYDCSIKAKLD